jgi:hypothetical protein
MAGERGENREKNLKLTTKAPKHQGMQIGTLKLCQVFLVPLCLGGENWFRHRVFQLAGNVQQAPFEGAGGRFQPS